MEWDKAPLNRLFTAAPKVLEPIMSPAPLLTPVLRDARKSDLSATKQVAEKLYCKAISVWKESQGAKAHVLFSTRCGTAEAMP